MTIMMPTSVNTSPNDRHDAGGEQIVQHVHVGRHAGHQASDGVAVVELDVEPLQVPVDLHAQVEHDALAGQLHGVRLHVLARERTEEDAEEPQRHPVQPRQVAGGDVACRWPA